MTTNDPDAIRRDIERTRADVSQDVNALADEAKPGNVVRRQVEDVKDSARNLKDRVFGSADDDPYDSGTDLRERAQQVGADARDAVQDAPRQLKQRTRGNPLAAGLIAFGIGALIGGMVPSSRKEQQLASDLKDRAQPLVDLAKESAKEAAESLQPQAQEAVETVRQSAMDSAQTVREEGQAQASDVRDQASTARDELR